MPKRPTSHPAGASALPTTVTTDIEVRAAKVAVLPVGAFEQHGPHLPLVTDTLVAAAIASDIAERHQLLQLPPITMACSHEHAAFPGTVSISATTLAALIADITASLTGQGVRALLLVNAHGGNYALSNIVQQSTVSGPCMGLYPSRQDWDEARQAAGMASTAHEDMHAGELETSILLARYPDYLRAGWDTDDHVADDRRQLTTRGVAAYSQSGVIGLPSNATAAKGHTALRQLAQNSDPIINIFNEKTITE